MIKSFVCAKLKPTKFSPGLLLLLLLHFLLKNPSIFYLPRHGMRRIVAVPGYSESRVRDVGDEPMGSLHRVDVRTRIIESFVSIKADP